MKECISREAALAALKTYNKEPFHILHALTVEGVMRWYANELGYGEDADFWATVGLLHDIDFEMWPEQHCLKAPELLEKAGCSDEFIHAVCSHGYGLVCDVEPTHQMEKVLFAADELTGLIGAAARMRPSKSVMDMEVSSLKKKYKDKKFAAGCSRDVIQTGAERLGWTLEELMERLQEQRFIRIHKSYIVNFDYIGEFCRQMVVLRDGTQLPVSRTYRAAVSEVMHKLLKESGVSLDEDEHEKSAA